MNRKIRRKHSKEYKLDVVRRVKSGNRTVAEVSRELGLNANMVNRWYKEFEALELLPPTAASKDEEIRRLRAELANAQEDNEILKKAAAYFARESR